MAPLHPFYASNLAAFERNLTLIKDGFEWRTISVIPHANAHLTLLRHNIQTHTYIYTTRETRTSDTKASPSRLITAFECPLGLHGYPPCLSYTSGLSCAHGTTTVNTLSKTMHTIPQYRCSPPSERDGESSSHRTFHRCSYASSRTCKPGCLLVHHDVAPKW